MSRRTQIIEEFDDDTDLPLPSQPLPNTGTSGPLLQEIDISDDEIEYASRPGPASPSRPQRGESSETPESKNTVTDITPYKAYVQLLPFLELAEHQVYYQLDVYLSYLPRCEASIYNWGKKGEEREGAMVATQQGHC